MNRYLRFSLLTLICMAILFSCKKSKKGNSGPTDPQTEQKDGGEISRYQIVSIDAKGTLLKEEQYGGTLGNIPVSLLKADDKRLIFIVPPQAVLGEQELYIPDLDDMRIGYQIKNPTLTLSAEATIEPLLSDFTTFADNHTHGSDSEAMQQNIRSIKKIFDHANAEQKAEMAKTYLANKELFESVFAEPMKKPSGNGSNSLQRTAGNNSPKTQSRATDLLLFGKYSSYIIVMGTSATVAYYAKPYAWHTPVLLGVAVVCAYKARTTFEEIIGIAWNNVNVKIDNLLGQLSVNSTKKTRMPVVQSTNTLKFKDNVASILPIQLQVRDLQESDINSHSEVFQDFFSDLAKITSYKTSINNAISWCNDNIPFSEMSLLQIDKVLSSAPVENIKPTSGILQHLKFSIDDPNLQLAAVSLTTDGQLSIKIKITGNTTENSINSILKYEYKDELSSFSGTVPVEVSNMKESIFGRWKITSIVETINNKTTSNKVYNNLVWNIDDVFIWAIIVYNGIESSSANTYRLLTPHTDGKNYIVVDFWKYYEIKVLTNTDAVLFFQIESGADLLTETVTLKR